VAAGNVEARMYPRGFGKVRVEVDGVQPVFVRAGRIFFFGKAGLKLPGSPTLTMHIFLGEGT
jgi:hypothetical protein